MTFLLEEAAWEHELLPTDRWCYCATSGNPNYPRMHSVHWQKHSVRWWSWWSYFLMSPVWFLRHSFSSGQTHLLLLWLKSASGCLFVSWWRRYSRFICDANILNHWWESREKFCGCGRSQACIRLQHARYAVVPHFHEIKPLHTHFFLWGHAPFDNNLALWQKLY